MPYGIGLKRVKHNSSSLIQKIAYTVIYTIHVIWIHDSVQFPWNNWKRNLLSYITYFQISNKIIKLYKHFLKQTKCRGICENIQKDKTISWWYNLLHTNTNLMDVWKPAHFIIWYMLCDLLPYIAMTKN